MNNLVGSPTFAPKMPLEEVLATCRDMGFTKFEIFTTWVHSAFDIDRSPSFYLSLAERYGLSFTSLHLPRVESNSPASLNRAIQAARFADALNVKVVIFKADTIDTYAETASSFLDAIEPLDLTAVVTNHAGTAISSLEDYGTVLNRIDDARMQALLEVGHFHAAGVPWRAGQDLLDDRIGLVHIKDMAGDQPVPYGEGEVDFTGLFQHMDDAGYEGNFVVELENIPPEHAVDRLGEAVAYLQVIQRAQIS